MDYFKKEAEKSSNTTNYQFWRHDNKPIELSSNAVIQQKIEYIHKNPVEKGLFLDQKIINTALHQIMQEKKDC